MPLPGGFSLRPAVIDDVDFWCRVRSTDPRLARDPMQARASWDDETPGVVRERSIILQGGIPIGILRVWLPPPAEGRPRFADLGAEFLDGEATDELRDAAWDMAEARARELGAEVLASHCYDHETERREYLAARGYLLDRAGIISGLRIGEQRERFLEEAAQTQEALRAAGVELTTMDRLPDGQRALYEVLMEAEADIPSTIPIVSESYEVFLKGLRQPWIGEHRVWVAVEGDRPLGMSWLKYEPVTGNVYTNFTGVARAARGRGLARALKLQTIVQALEAGVDMILTENDAENAPILKINRDFGYQPVRENLSFRKPA